MDRHAMFSDLAEFDHFRSDLWYHWLPTTAKDPYAPEETMCNFCEISQAWTARGFPLTELCKNMCIPTGHIDQCAYRLQGGRPERIIAAVHEHISVGMAIKDYSVVFCDELPLRAFLQIRHIPKDGIVLSNSWGPVNELLLKLHYLASTTDRILKGKDLLDEIGDLLRDVYDQFGG